jgi:hypothetical protein
VWCRVCCIRSDMECLCGVVCVVYVVIWSVYVVSCVLYGGVYVVIWSICVVP